MNPVLETIHARKSIRAYKDQGIPEDVRNSILQATLRAPTAGNMMLYSIVEVTDQALKDQLVETCDHQPFIAQAPWVLLFLADYQRWCDYFEVSGVEEYCESRSLEMIKPRAGDLMLACCDALIAAQTAVIAAQALGVGSCYIGDILENFETHQDMFGLPTYAVPIALLCFGYPTDDQLEREKTDRFDPEFIVFRDSYRRMEKDAFDRMFARRKAHAETSGGDATDVGVAIYKRKFSAAYAEEMRRSVEVMLQRWSSG